MTALLIVVGRFLIGVYFLQAGIRNVLKREVHVGILTRKNLPMPREGLYVALAVQVLGGASVAFGVLPVAGALGLIAFTIVANALYHNPLDYPAAERESQVGSLLTNAAIIGGLLLVIALS